MTEDSPLPFVTIVIPVLNEERFIVPLLSSLGCIGGQKCLPGPHEIILVDGGSTDRTLAILDSIKHESGIRVVHNRSRIQSAGVNLAAREASPEAKYLIRIDAHATYSSGFVECVVRSLANTSAASVVVPLISTPREGATGFVQAVAAAQRSLLGNGGSLHRLATTSAKWVDHGHHAGFDLSFFRSLGGYDESFATNEDAEYDVRVAAVGGGIWFEPTAIVWYSPRETAMGLARQYFRYGYGRAMTLVKHGLYPKPRQCFPLAALVTNALALIVAATFWGPAILFPAAYLLICFLAAYLARKSAKIVDRPFIDAEITGALATMHMSWAVGFVVRMLEKVGLKLN
jgi:succinoglycan biosynthesis protein ExoA